MLVPLMNATRIPPLTTAAAGKTTRKAPAARAAAALALALTAGCATPGPLHRYAFAPGQPDRVADLGPTGAGAVPSLLAPGERVTGLAYDPFTDHLFLRLAPGDRIRVVDRPARRLKRELELADGTKGTLGGDLAVRPRNGHLFLLTGPAGDVAEHTRLGRPVRRFALEGVAEAPRGLAFDATRDELVALAADGRTVSRHDLAGRRRGAIRLATAAAGPLACDGAIGELHAVLAGEAGEVGIFGPDGAQRGTWRAGGPGALIDLGPRSFLRVF
jgi:hypothetical protein